MFISICTTWRCLPSTRLPCARAPPRERPSRAGTTPSPPSPSTKACAWTQSHSQTCPRCKNDIPKGLYPTRNLILIMDSAHHHFLLLPPPRNPLSIRHGLTHRHLACFRGSQIAALRCFGKKLPKKVHRNGRRKAGEKRVIFQGPGGCTKQKANERRAQRCSQRPEGSSAITGLLPRRLYVAFPKAVTLSWYSHSA